MLTKTRRKYIPADRSMLLTVLVNMFIPCTKRSHSAGYSVVEQLFSRVPCHSSQTIDSVCYGRRRLRIASYRDEL